MEFTDIAGKYINLYRHQWMLQVSSLIKAGIFRNDEINISIFQQGLGIKHASGLIWFSWQWLALIDWKELGYYVLLLHMETDKLLFGISTWGTGMCISADYRCTEQVVSYKTGRLALLIGETQKINMHLTITLLLIFHVKQYFFQPLRGNKKAKYFWET